MKNYLKIEFNESTPVVSMEYDSIESFQNLIFFLLSPTGTDLFIKTIEKQLVESKKEAELETIKTLTYILSKDSNDALLDALDASYPLIKPSSFK